MKKILLLCFLLTGTLAYSQSKPDSAEVKRHICPVCKSDKDVVPIRYGKPTAATIKMAERGECRLGGCIVSAISPKYYCKKDETSF